MKIQRVNRYDQSVMWERKLVLKKSYSSSTWLGEIREKVIEYKRGVQSGMIMQLVTEALYLRITRTVTVQWSRKGIKRWIAKKLNPGPSQSAYVAGMAVGEKKGVSRHEPEWTVEVPKLQKHGSTVCSSTKDMQVKLEAEAGIHARAINNEYLCAEIRTRSHSPL
jgi:repressor of nif and glnA expression